LAGKAQRLDQMWLETVRSPDPLNAAVGDVGCAALSCAKTHSHLMAVESERGRIRSSMHPLAFFKNCRLARMSDGHYCLLRDLGPVKGAKAMKHHEVVIDFSRRGLLETFRRLISRKKPSV
jgi:hypothetical protein